MNTITAKLYKSGNSYSLRLPKRVVDEYQLKEGQDVSMSGLSPVTPVKYDPKKIRETLRDLQRIVAENTKNGTGIGTIEDAVAWQREIRKDRALPGRD